MRSDFSLNNIRRSRCVLIFLSTTVQRLLDPGLWGPGFVVGEVFAIECPALPAHLMRRPGCLRINPSFVNPLLGCFDGRF